MSHIYTAASITAKKVQNPAFTKKGLDGLTSGQLERIHHVGLAAEKQIAYDGYIQNLPAFLHATAVQSKVSAHVGWFPAKLDLDHLIPIPLPPLVLASRTPFSNEEEKVKFKQSLGENVEEIRAPKCITFLIRKPTASMLKTLPYKDIDPSAQSPPDATSLVGLRSFILTLKIISLFLATHSYPYKQMANDRFDRFGNDVAFAWTEADCFYSRDDGVRGEGDGSCTKEEAMTGDDIVGSVFDLDDKGSFNSGRGAYLIAKPAPLRPSINYGPPQSTPNFPGYVLPYFRGLVEPSKVTIINVIRRFFLGCLADSKEKAGNAWFEWNRGLDKWYQTESGRIVAHILFNIQTALEAQARLFLCIRSNEYLGSAILGYGSAVLVDGKFVAPATAVEVRKLALELDSHSLAVSQIIEIVNRKRQEESLMEVDVAEFTSTRKLYRFIVDSPKVENDDLELLTSLVSKISFEDRLFSAVVTNITRCLDLLSVDDPVDDLPMYLDPTLIYNTTRAHQVLSAFGPIAPSFLESVGQDYPIPKGPLDEDPASVIDTSTGKRPLEAIYVSLKKLPVAVGDWQNVVKKRRIRQNAEKRDAGFRTIEFRGDMRDQIWASLKRIPFVEKGGKRKRVDDDEEGADEGSSAKKGKVKETPADFTYDDFM